MVEVSNLLLISKGDLQIHSYRLSNFGCLSLFGGYFHFFIRGNTLDFK